MLHNVVSLFFSDIKSDTEIIILKIGKQKLIATEISNRKR